MAGVLGIRYGLEGFIPKYGHEVRELTPENVSNIHEFGGTVLGAARGPQSAEEIVDALERRDPQGAGALMKAHFEDTRQMMERAKG